jgi:hypothetical protein
MFCPRCGTENETGNRFCVSCGSSLSQRPQGKESPPPTLRKRLGALLGETRRARILTAATLVAIVVAAIAFIALDSGDDKSEDAYLRQVDQTCVAEKERVSQLEQETLLQKPPNVTEFASVLVTVVAEWRAALKENPAPPVHAAEIEELDVALREVLIEAGGLARLSREDASPAAIGTQAAAVDAATANAGSVIEQLGLDSCTDLSVGPAAPSAQ